MNNLNSNLRSHEFSEKGELFRGDLFPRLMSVSDVKNDKRIVGDFAIHKITSRRAFGFRRSWSHIRSDKINLTLMWFVRRGSLTVSVPGARHRAEVDQCTVTRSNKPFYMELGVDAEGVFEAMHVVAPSHLLYAIIPEQIEPGRPFSMSEGALRIAERMLLMLFEEGGRVDAEIATQMIGILLQGLGRTLQRLAGSEERYLSKSDERLYAVLEHIGRNFANSGLNTGTVAADCGISVRYLFDLLKERGLSLTELLWEKRVTTARDWLNDDRMRSQSIAVIAQRAGFKSSAHFSRVFKDKYGVSPRQFRRSAPTICPG
jgi:AraC-like DNA-binding protein